MWLHVGVIGAEQLLGALDGQGLGDVDDLAAAVVALARIALGIFVGEDRALRFHHRLGDDVLAGDQLDLGLLALQLMRDTGKDGGIGIGQVAGEKPAGWTSFMLMGAVSLAFNSGRGPWLSLIHI